MLEVYKALLRSTFPAPCPRCAARASEAYCAACRREFAKVRDPCRRCGLPRPVSRCPRRALRWEVDAVHAPYMYTYPLDDEILALKSGRGRALGRALGTLVAASAPAAGDIDALVPVPLHVRRLRERGYNQAAEIAAGIGVSLGLEVIGAAGRVRATARQAGLGARERALNLTCGFAASPRVAGLAVVVVDDVITTGATANALAAALRAAGARRVEAWAVARTLPGTASQIPRNV